MTDDYLNERAAFSFINFYLPQKAPNAVPFEINALYDFVSSTVGIEKPITYLEFGVYDGRSITDMAGRFAHPKARFYGFDSFEGLPEDWALPWGTTTKGTFSRAGIAPVIADNRVQLVKGWFQNTLRDFLRDTFIPSGPILVHYDADLYSATMFVLGMLWPVIDEYYFLFDEFNGHECLALHDFSKCYPVEIEFICQTNDPGVEKVFGKLRRAVL
jgi:O-methyltransferase